MALLEVLEAEAESRVEPPPAAVGDRIRRVQFSVHERSTRASSVSYAGREFERCSVHSCLCDVDSPLVISDQPMGGGTPEDGMPEQEKPKSKRALKRDRHEERKEVKQRHAKEEKTSKEEFAIIKSMIFKYVRIDHTDVGSGSFSDYSL